MHSHRRDMAQATEEKEAKAKMEAGPPAPPSGGMRDALTPHAKQPTPAGVQSGTFRAHLCSPCPLP